MLPIMHSSCYTGSAEAGVEGRSPPRTCTASPRVGLPSDDEENQQRESILTDYDHAGPNCSSGDDLLINISRTGSDHGSRCDDVGLFREAELAKRRRNVLKRFSSIGSGDQVGNQIFVSHCWRSGDPARQKRKFDLFSSLTQARREGGPGLIFWADFLDLHAEGPVPWRREIEIAIQQCSKMVCFIDQDYLLSFNCLQELAYAVEHNKPLVVVMMDQGAWDLLTMMGGPETAWGMQPTNGAALRNFEGVELIPGKPMTLGALTRLYTTLSSINFCACRELDFVNLGPAAVFHNLCKFVVKDLEYANEHSWLQHRALQWMMQDYPPSQLLNRSDSMKWADWCHIGLKSGILPVPTKLQLQYVKASKASVLRSRRLLRLVVVFVMALILAGGIVAGVMAVRASDAEQAARASEAEAQTAQREAVVARGVAEMNARIAQENAEIAEEQRGLMAVRERQVALLLLSTTRLPRRGDEVRAVLQATEVASLVGEQPLVHPALHAAVKYMTSLPYIFWELEGHANWVRAVAFSPDSKALASASDDGSVRVWPMGKSTGAMGVPAWEESTVLICDGSPILSLRWSPRGAHIAVGTKRGTVCVWRNSWWEYWQHDDEPSSLWNASTPLVIRHAHRNDIYALAFVRDGQFLATGGNDNALRLWDLRPAAFEAALLNASRTSGGDVEDDEIASLAELLPKQGGDVRALAWNGVGGRRLLASGATDESIVIWDLSDSTAPELVVRYDDAHDDDINSLAFSSDGSLLASGSDDTTVKVWRVAGGVRLGGAGSNATSLNLQSLHVLSQHTDSVREVAWSINGVLATVSADANARLYRQSDLIDLGPSGVLDGELVDSDEEKGDGALDPQPFETLDGRGSLFTSGAWSPDGSQLAMGSAGDRVRVWKKAVELGTFGPQLLELACHQGRDSVRSVAWTHDAFRVATGSTDASVCVWESDGVRGWRHDPGVHALRGHGRAVRGLTWSGDGNSLAAADDSGLVTVWTFDGVTWLPRRLENLKGKGAVRSVAFSGDTSLLSAGSFGSTVGVWHLQSNAFAELGGDHVLGLSSGIGAMKADAAAEATASWGHTRAVRAVAWAPDDNDGAESPRRWRLATGAADDLILVWELTQIDGTLNLTRVPAVLKGHTTTVRSLEWSVEGRLASSSDDDTVRVWDELDSDEQRDTVSREFDVEDESTSRRGWRSTLTLAGHQSNVRSVSWSPRGTHIASAGLDSTVMIWPVSVDAVKNAGAPDAWRIDEDCRWSRWLHTATVKLACARQSPVEGYSFEMDMLMVDFRQQSKLLRQMTYGQLNSADLAALGYPMLGWVLDLVPRPEHNLPDGVSVDFLPLLPGSGLPFAELGDLAGNLSRSGAFDTFIRPSFIGNETLNY